MNKLYTVVLALFLAGCASVNLVDSSGQDLMKSQNVVLKTNLHPDPVRHRLYTVNYQQPGLIPMCTEVELVELSDKRLVFKVKSTGVQYTLDRHRSTADLAAYLHDYFGTSCNKEKLNNLSDIDKEGIKKGKALKGMSKEAVILALGFPPKHKTPNLETNQWRYWLNRWKTMVVEFDDSGKVSAIAL